MHDFDIVGYVYEGEIYCPDCLPETPAMDEYPPIFAGDEAVDCPMHCGECGALIEGQALTAEGMDYVAEHIAEHIVSGRGRSGVLAEWWCLLSELDLIDRLARSHPSLVAELWRDGYTPQDLYVAIRDGEYEQERPDHED